MALKLQALLGPSCGNDFGNLMVGHIGQAGRHVFEIGLGIKAPSQAAFDDGVKDGSPFSRIGITH